MISTKYSKGKGNLFGGLWDGDVAPSVELPFGNLADISLAQAISNAEIESAFDGIGDIDFSYMTENKKTLKFNCYDTSPRLLSYLFASNIVVDSQLSEVVTDAVTAVLGASVILSKREVGSYGFSIGAVTDGPFEIGEVVTGGTSDATGKVAGFVSGKLYIVVDEGADFSSAEVVTGGHSTATATLASVGVFAPGKVIVKLASGSTFYTVTTDNSVTGADCGCLELTSDSYAGRVYISETGSIVEGASLQVIYNCKASVVKKLVFGSQPEIYCSLRFMSKNQVGSKGISQFYFPKVQLVAEGDISLLNLKDEVQKLSFTGTVVSSGGASDLKIFE